MCISHHHQLHHIHSSYFTSSSTDHMHMSNHDTAPVTRGIIQTNFHILSRVFPIHSSKKVALHNAILMLTCLICIALTFLHSCRFQARLSYPNLLPRFLLLYQAWHCCNSLTYLCFSLSAPGTIGHKEPFKFEVEITYWTDIGSPLS